jgi:hypothetical protein
VLLKKIFQGDSMTKKILIILILLVLSSALFAQGAGTRLGFGVGEPNMVLIFRPSPFDLKIGYDFTEGNEFLFVSGDFRIIDTRWIASIFYVSLGIGGYLRFVDMTEEPSIEGGARIPVALQILLLDDFLEFFVEVAPGFDLFPRAQLAEDPVQYWIGFTLQLD